MREGLTLASVDAPSAKPIKCMQRLGSLEYAGSKQLWQRRGGEAPFVHVLTMILGDAVSECMGGRTHTGVKIVLGEGPGTT